MNLKDNDVWQILYINPRNLIPRLNSWYVSKSSAIKQLAWLNKHHPDQDYIIEKGTDYIINKCRHCGTVFCEERFDHYDISTGYYCDDDYKNNYPYRTDAYFDPAFAGESMEEQD